MTSDSVNLFAGKHKSYLLCSSMTSCLIFSGSAAKKDGSTPSGSGTSPNTPPPGAAVPLVPNPLLVPAGARAAAMLAAVEVAAALEMALLLADALVLMVDAL